ncbi:hypothetical protein AB685_03070 [Bacillus sp. LL01]|uniref:DUF7683 domain-containing protein n=1 Tax=Bacillus sp. LL01 TaxID=1665556 RepID=UPI00064D0E1D|nr:hypothetical protein [Bacillus sp. LL01]KMJ59853.1 hypothetical protein AB685_03070 [Bacillus sp. LL01]
MSKEIKNQWRISKYNPIFRDSEGIYTKTDEWTSVSELGKVIDGKPFTINEYLEIEQAFIDSIMRFIKLHKFTSIRIYSLEINKSTSDSKSALYEPNFDSLNLTEDSEIDIENIPTVCKMILREYIFCHLISEQFFIHFAYESYLFFGSNSIQSDLLDIGKNDKIFIEKMHSPYYIPEKNVKRILEWNRKGESIIEGEELLMNITLEEFRRELCLSNIHPVIGAFPISKEHSNFFQKKIKHKMDFSKYNYTLFAGN